MRRQPSQTSHRHRPKSMKIVRRSNINQLMNYSQVEDEQQERAKQQHLQHQEQTNIRTKCQITNYTIVRKSSSTSSSSLVLIDENKPRPRSITLTPSTLRPTQTPTSLISMTIHKHDHHLAYNCVNTGCFSPLNQRRSHCPLRGLNKGLLLALLALSCLLAASTNQQVDADSSNDGSGARFSQRFKKSSDKLNTWFLKEVAPKVANKMLDNLFQAPSVSASSSSVGSAVLSGVSALVGAGASKSTAPSKLEEVAQQQARNLVSSGYQVAQNLIREEGRKIFGRAMEKQLDKLLQKTAYSMGPSNSGNTNSNINSNSNGGSTTLSSSGSPLVVSEASSTTPMPSMVAPSMYAGGSLFNSTKGNQWTFDQVSAESVNNQLDENPLVFRAEHAHNVTVSPLFIGAKNMLLQQQQQQYHIQSRSKHGAQTSSSGHHRQRQPSVTTISSNNKQKGLVPPLRPHQQSPYVHQVVDQQQQQQVAHQSSSGSPSSSPILISSTSEQMDANIVTATVPDIATSTKSPMLQVVSKLSPAVIQQVGEAATRVLQQQLKNQQHHSSHLGSSSSPNSSPLINNIKTRTEGNKIVFNNRHQSAPSSQTLGHQSWFSTNRPTPNSVQHVRVIATNRLSAPTTSSTTTSTTTTTTSTTTTTTEAPPTAAPSSAKQQAQQQLNKSPLSGQIKNIAAAAATTARQSILSQESIPTALGAPLYHHRANYTPTSIIVPPKKPTTLDLMRPNAKLAAQYLQKGITSVSSTIFGRQQMNWARRLGISSVLLSGLWYILSGIPTTQPGALEALGLLGKNKRRGGGQGVVEPLLNAADSNGLLAGAQKLTLQQQQQKLMPVLEQLFRQEHRQQQLLTAMTGGPHLGQPFLPLPLLNNNLIKPLDSSSSGGQSTMPLISRLVSNGGGLETAVPASNDDYGNPWKVFNQAQDTIRRRKR